MKFFSFSFFLLFSLSITFAQTDSLFISDFHDFIYTSADYYTSPLRFESEDWVRLSAVVGITVIASLADKEVKNFSQRNQSDFADAVLKIDKYYYAEFVGASIIAFYGYGLIAENSENPKACCKAYRSNVFSLFHYTCNENYCGTGPALPTGKPVLFYSFYF